MKDKKQLIISTCLIIVLILAVIGISYAAFSYIGRVPLSIKLQQVPSV